ncbi:MAG: histidine kinase [Bacillota bacterium]|nr:histidine kinase [Bacillota bacterium]
MTILRNLKLIRQYRFNSILLKYFAIILVFLLLPVLIVSVYSVNTYKKLIENEMEYLNNNTMNQVRETIDAVYIEAEKYMFQLSNNQDIQDFVKTDQVRYANFTDIQKSRNVIQAITITSFISDYIHSVVVYAPGSGYVFSSNQGGTEIGQYDDKDWLGERAVLDQAPRYFVARTLPVSGEPVISSVMRVPFSQDVQNGYIVLNISIDKIAQQADQRHSPIIDDIIIRDNDHILYTLQSRDLEPAEWQSLIDVGKNNQVVTIGQESKYLYVADSQVSNWQYILLYSTTHYQQQVARIATFFLILMAISVVGALLVSMIISVKVYTPIQGILDTIKDPTSSGKEMQSIMKTPEIEQIVGKINASSDEINNLQEMLEQRLALFRQAKSAALQAQINPHFICNILDSINWLAIDLAQGDNKVSNMLVMLSDFLRISLDTDNTLIPIQEEINHVQIYIGMMSVCNGRQYDVVWQVDEEVRRLKTIRLLLQPIVENAIEHGLIAHDQVGQIVITGTLNDQSVVLSVHDNGIGIPETDINRMNQEMEQGYGRVAESIGLRNINQRIKLLYGDDYGVTLEPATQSGVIVKIVIPKID